MIPRSNQTFSYFPNLTKLVVIGSELDGLTKVEFCYQLTELWLCEAGLQSVPDLSDCSNLQKLLLYQNDLKVLNNLEPLDNLQVRFFVLSPIYTYFRYSTFHATN